MEATSPAASQVFTRPALFTSTLDSSVLSSLGSEVRSICLPVPSARELYSTEAMLVRVEPEPTSRSTTAV